MSTTCRCASQVSLPRNDAAECQLQHCTAVLSRRLRAVCGSMTRTALWLMVPAHARAVRHRCLREEPTRHLPGPGAAALCWQQLRHPPGSSSGEVAQSQHAQLCLPWHAGHSLGGALAELAAHSFALRARDRQSRERHGWDVSQRMCCYTFGAPRVGNAAWAAEGEALVPATFQTINDQVRTGCTNWGPAARSAVGDSSRMGGSVPKAHMHVPAAALAGRVRASCGSDVFVSCSSVLGLLPEV